MLLPILTSVLFLLLVTAAGYIVALRRRRHQFQTAVFAGFEESTITSEAFALIMEEFSVNANRQAAIMQRVLDSVSGLSATSAQASSNANASSARSEESVAAAAKGQVGLNSLIGAVEEVKAQSEIMGNQIEESNIRLMDIVKIVSEIGEKAKVINEIVFQTKLLSFNASVEASRAGEHGKGFSVVASEIGKLAKMSGDAATEIGHLLDSGVAKVRSIVEDNKAKSTAQGAKAEQSISSVLVAANQCSKTFDDIVQNTAESKKLMEEITTACDKQNQSMDIMSSLIKNVEDVALLNSQLSKKSILSHANVNAANLQLRRSIGLVRRRAQQSDGKDFEMDQRGVSPNEIRLGISNAISGPSAALGRGVSLGADVGFKMNAAQSPPGARAIKISHLDDAYDPKRATANTRQLIERDQVFALFGYVGTPTIIACKSMIHQAQVPCFAPYSGAQALRLPVDANIFNVRASYLDEARAIVSFLRQKKPSIKIAVFIQDDGYGAAGEAAMTIALAEHKMEICGKGVYQRGTTEIEFGFQAVQKSQPDAVVMVGTYKACGAFCHKVKREDLSADLFSLSFIGTSAFIEEAGSDAEGVFITQVLPSPWDTSIPISRSYQEQMRASGHNEFDYTSFEGFVDALIFSKALSAAGANLSRSVLKESLEKLNVDLGGFSVSFGPDRHSGSDRVWLTQIQNQKCVSIQEF